MAINFLRWLTGKNGSITKEVTSEEMEAAAQELSIRIMAFNVCVNMIANAIGKCEFKTYKDSKPVKEREYYMLNYEPNTNQNSTMFWHEFIYRLCKDNEVLCISTTARDGHEMLVVADSWDKPDKYPAKQNEYKNVKAGEVAYRKTFRENEVLHLKLNHMNTQPMIDAIYGSYSKLINAAQKSYTRSRGVRMKVKVDQVASGGENFAKDFKDLMDQQVKPWINSDSGVLPQFDGYEYTDMTKDSGYKAESSRDIKAMIDDIFTFTARCMGITPVLVTGEVADTKDAMTRTLTTCIDPLCDQIQEEMTRKRYGFEEWKKGNFVQIDTTTIIHFDMFANAANVEKLIGSGAFSINDVLAAAGLPEIDAPWAKKHWLTLNIGTMEAAARAADHGEKGGKET
jgi:HK97 family phage portal protein